MMGLYIEPLWFAQTHHFLLTELHLGLKKLTSTKHSELPVQTDTVGKENIFHVAP